MAVELSRFRVTVRREIVPGDLKLLQNHFKWLEFDNLKLSRTGTGKRSTEGLLYRSYKYTRITVLDNGSCSGGNIFKPAYICQLNFNDS